MKKISLKVLFLLTAGILCGFSQHDIAFRHGEKLVFMISYRAKLIPSTDVAQVTLEVNKTNYQNTDAFQITANGKVMPFFRWFFDLNDTYNTWLDSSSLRPLYATCDIREGGYRFMSRYRYDWPNRRVHTTYRNLKRTEDTNKVMSLTDHSYDGLALFYNLRSTAPNDMLRGHTQYMQLVLEDTVRVLSYKFLGRERKKVKGLGEFRTLKFSCNMVTSSGESFEDGTELYLWVSDDQNRIPLYIETPIKVGSVRARLMTYENLKYPLHSKIK